MIEEKVRERTKELLKANIAMKEEIIQRKRAWEKLKQKELKIKTIELRETNTASNGLLKRRQLDKEEVEEKMVTFKCSGVLRDRVNGKKRSQ